MIVGPLFPLLLLPTVLINFSIVSAEDSPGQFFNPATSGPVEDYSSNAVWRVGEVQTIKFTTTYSSYTIDLWQQNKHGGSAAQGPTIFRTYSGTVTQFEWPVQTYQFDLETSEVFYLLLEPIDQDSNDPVSCHYFNMTANAVSSSSSVSSSTSFTSTSATTTAAITSAVSSGSVTPNPSPTQTASSLSTGAQAGIGVGVGLAGLVAIVAGVLVWRHRQRNNNRGPPAGSDYADQVETMRGPREGGQPKYSPSPYPVELHGDSGVGESLYRTPRSPVELG